LNNKPTHQRLRGWRASVLALALLTVPAAAHADLTIVAEVTTTGPTSVAARAAAGAPAGGAGGARETPPPPPPSLSGTTTKQTVTTYYRGRKARSEVKNGPVTLYDADAGKVYRLDPARKTYRVFALRDVLDGKVNPNGGLLASIAAAVPTVAFGRTAPGAAVAVEGAPVPVEGAPARPARPAPTPEEEARRRQMVEQVMNRVESALSFRTTLTMSETSEQATVAQQQAQKIDLKGEINTTFDTAALGFGAGGAAQPGVVAIPPGGARARGNAPGGAFQIPPTAVTGEAWVGRGVFALLPDNGRLGLYPTTNGILTGPGAAQMAKTVADRMVKAQAIPLALRLNLAIASPRGDQSFTSSTEMLVTAVSGEALPDSLFAIPEGYTETAAPSLLESLQQVAPGRAGER
jgi:hypothetical protein